MTSAESRVVTGLSTCAATAEEQHTLSTTSFADIDMVVKLSVVPADRNGRDSEVVVQIRVSIE